MKPSLATALMLVGVVTLTPATLKASPPQADALGSHVRSSHTYLRAVIAEAELRSVTFRRMVAAIDATDGIVYVEHGACTPSIHTCLVRGVTMAAGYRILRVHVDARQPDWDLMASIGHELRHALEVLEDPGLTSGTSIYFYYAKDRSTKEPPFETREAMDAEDAVRKEVTSFAKPRLH